MQELLYFCFALYTQIQAASTYEAVPDKDEPASLKLPWFVKVTWVLQGVVFAAATVVGLMYWVLVYPDTKEKKAELGEPNWEPNIISMIKHGGNTLAIYIDMAVAVQPFLLMHAIYAAMYSIAFMSWSYIHYALEIGNEDGDPYIYKVLDWSRPEVAGKISFMVGLMGIPIICGLGFCFFGGNGMRGRKTPDAAV